MAAALLIAIIAALTVYFGNGRSDYATRAVNVMLKPVRVCVSVKSHPHGQRDSRVELPPYGFGIVRDYVGHGVGAVLHEDPEIPNYGVPGHGPETTIARENESNPFLT